jgi:hypothetical protein
MLRRVALVRTDFSEERSAFIIRMTRIGEIATTLAVTSNRRTLRRTPSHPVGTVPTNVLFCSVRRLLVTANFVLSALILVTMMMETLG